MNHKIPLDEALSRLGRTDPSFNEEVRRRLGPVRDRFFDTSSNREDQDVPGDGLRPTPRYLRDPDLREVAIELAQLAIERGVDVNLACEPEGSMAPATERAGFQGA